MKAITGKVMNNCHFIAAISVSLSVDSLLGRMVRFIGELNIYFKITQ